MKRFFIILAVILVIGGVVYAGYFLSKKSATTPPPTPDTAGTLPSPAGTAPQGTTPEVSTGAPENTASPSGATGALAALSLVSSEKFVSFSVATSGAVLGIRPDGVIFSVSPQGKSSIISSSPIDGLTGASFSSDGKKLLASWGAPENRQFSVFDVASSTWQTLPLNTVSAAWQPQSHIVGYLQDQSGAKVLYSWNLDKPKTKASLLLTLHFEDITLGYLSPTKVYLTGKSSGLVKNFLSTYDISKKILTPVFQDAYGLETKWNSSGSSVLAFFAGQNAVGGSLRISDQTGRTINQLQVATLPGKCLFSADVFTAPVAVSTSTKIKVVSPPPPENFLYCAIPRDKKAFSSSLLPDDYLQLKLLTEDSIYRIDLDSRLIYSVFDDTNKSFDVRNPKIIGTTLFFINRYDQNLYALPIPRG
jgi:hypothetical protein